jgi:hypothetical protein
LARQLGLGFGLGCAQQTALGNLCNALPPLRWNFLNYD